LDSGPGYDGCVLFGRDAERAAIGALLEAARRSQSGAVVVRGEPGIGKTVLLEDARDRAADMHVLTARGVESESELPFAALHQLIRPGLDHVKQLPAPQAVALRGALGLEEAPAGERFLVFAACLSLLSEMAERRPVLCLVDDAQWLDTASADALLFVARRLDAEGIVMLFAAREGSVRDFEAADVPSLVLEGLEADAAETLVSRIAGDAVASVRDRLIEQTRGNALALVELPSALSRAQLAGEEPLPEALPLTHQVESVFLERVRTLPDDTQRLLLLAAADDSGDARLLTRAAALLGDGARALDAAEDAGLVLVHGSRLVFRHPLVRSALYGAVTSSARREAHRALANALEGEDSDADRRAWHLAASVLEPDEQVVRALEAAAERAAKRGGQMAAAKALARAAELSVDREGRGRRLAYAARAARIAAADEYARALANQAEPLVDDPLLRAEIACAIGAAEVRRGRPLEGFPRLIQAAREVASLDLQKAVEVLVGANAAAFTVGNVEALAEVSKAADEVVPLGGEHELMHVVRALGAFARTLEGRMPGADEREEAFVWASSSDDPELVYLVSAALGLMGDDQRFGPLLDRAVSLARARGELGTLVQGLTARALRHAFLQHRFDAAARAGEESLRFARELGAVNIATISLCVLGYVAAIRGKDEEARRHAGEALEVAEANGIGPRVVFALYALAMLDLGRGQWAASIERLQDIVNSREGHTLIEKWALPDLVEAAVRAGQLSEAHEALSSFEEWAAVSGPPWAQARLASCRALLANDGERSTAHFEEALQIGVDERPFDLGRIQLLYGEHLRRERRRKDARVQLRAALEGFERLKAEPWAERARAELRATGETARKRDPSTIDQLTPQEVQIARFVADGLSNKEVAARLFLSPRTIDYHLRNVFSKLGITSRTQLARFPLGDESAVSPARTPVPA
jgi:DNA-binding CsgD family transcriptional regulator/tetratricopeptide (TPR) repeat protein